MIPDASNFFASLYTARSRRAIAELSAPTWIVRKCSWADYEVRSSFAELIIEAESPMMLHRPVAEVEADADRVLATLRAAWIGYTAECYDDAGELLQQWKRGTKPVRAAIT